jgi:hypothetical protein
MMRQFQARLRLESEQNETCKHEDAYGTRRSHSPLPGGQIRRIDSRSSGATTTRSPAITLAVCKSLGSTFSPVDCKQQVRE